MKKNLSLVIAVATCLLCAVCLLQISSLRQKVQDLQASVNNNMGSMRSTISSVYDNIDSKLEAQSNLLAKGDWAFGEMDIAQRTIALVCTVSPKEYQPGVTTATLYCNGAQYPMKLADGAFTVSLPIALFAESHVAKVAFEENGTVRTQSLDWYLSPRYAYLPEVYANFSGSIHGTRKDNAYVWSPRGQVEIFVESKDRPADGPADVRSIYMLVCVDGQETVRTEIPLNTEPSAQSGATVYMEPAAQAGDMAAMEPAYFYHPLDMDFHIPSGSTFELYVEVLDGDGLHYRVLLEHIAVSRDGEPVADGYDGSYTETKVYDDAGHLLYGG